jgi:hypothetical protein
MLVGERRNIIEGGPLAISRKLCECYISHKNAKLSSRRRRGVFPTVLRMAVVKEGVELRCDPNKYPGRHQHRALT